MLDIEADNKWASDRNDFDASTLPLLQEHGKTIGSLGYAGDAQCQKIMRLYKMLHLSFDPVTHLLLKEELSKYLERDKVPASNLGGDPSGESGSPKSN